MEENFFKIKLNLILKNENKKKNLQINNDIYSYFRIKTLTSFLTAILTFFYSFFWETNFSITFGYFFIFFKFYTLHRFFVAVLLPSIFSAIQFMNFFEP